jgi:hypothetical protein
MASITVVSIYKGILDEVFQIGPSTIEGVLFVDIDSDADEEAKAQLIEGKNLKRFGKREGLEKLFKIGDPYMTKEEKAVVGEQLSNIIEEEEYES